MGGDGEKKVKETGRWWSMQDADEKKPPLTHRSVSSIVKRKSLMENANINLDVLNNNMTMVKLHQSILIMLAMIF